jgi:hypothetical protein
MFKQTWSEAQPEGSKDKLISDNSEQNFRPFSAFNIWKHLQVDNFDVPDPQPGELCLVIVDGRRHRAETLVVEDQVPIWRRALVVSTPPAE